MSEYEVAGTVVRYEPLRYILYPETPLASVDAVHERSILDVPFARAVNPVGAVGAVVSVVVVVVVLLFVGQDT